MLVNSCLFGSVQGSVWGNKKSRGKVPSRDFLTMLV